MFNKTNIIKLFAANGLLKIFLAALILISFGPSKTLANVVISQGSTINTSALNDDDSVLFTGSSSGTLNHNSSELFLNDVLTNNNGVGLIVINANSQLNLFNVGSAAKKIDRVLFNVGSILNIRGNFFSQNGIDTNTDFRGDVSISGDNSVIVFDHFGARDFRLVNIAIGAQNVSLSGNIFSESFYINSLSSVTISNLAEDNDLGRVEIQPNSQWTLNSDAKIRDLITSSDNIINIAIGKQINVVDSDDVSLGNVDLNGTLNLNIERSNSSKPSILLGSGDATVNDGVNINFNYSNANYLKVGDSYNFIQSNFGLVDADVSQLNFTDNSILLRPLVLNNGNKLTLISSIDNNSLSQLNSRQLAAVNFLLNNQDAQDIDLARTELLKISTQEDLESSLQTLQVPQNNMLFLTPFIVSNQIDNLITNHIQSSIYEKLINSYQLLNKAAHQDQKNEAIAKRFLWGEVFGGSLKQNSIDNQAGFDSQSNGFIFGFDKVIENNQIIGAAFSYAASSLNEKSINNRSANIDSYQLSLYRNFTNKNGVGFFNDNLISLAYNVYNTNRDVRVGLYQAKAKSSFSGKSYSAKTAFGYNFKISKKLSLAPIASLKYFGLELEDYQESSAVGLKVKNNYFQIITSDFGARFAGQLTPEIGFKINGSWSQNLKNNGVTTVKSFSDGSGRIADNNVDIEKNFLNFGSEINFKASDNSSITINYQNQSGNSFKNQFAGIRCNIKF